MNANLSAESDSKSQSGFDLLTQKPRVIRSDEIIQVRERDTAVTLGLPHAGTWLPKLTLDHLTKAPFLLLDTDMYTDQVFGLVREKVSSVYTVVNPYVVNCNRSKKRVSVPVIPKRFIYGQPTLLKNYSPAEEKFLIANYYDTYHEALRELILRAKNKYGYCVHIDGHSLSSIGGPKTKDPGEKRASFTVGDYLGRSADAKLTKALVRALEKFGREYGWTVSLNQPYAGGFTTRHYGNPAKNVHALQIEVNKSLYMNDLGTPVKLTGKNDFAIDKAGSARLSAVLSKAITELSAKAKQLYG